MVIKLGRLDWKALVWTICSCEGQTPLPTLGRVFAVLPPILLPRRPRLQGCFVDLAAAVLLLRHMLPVLPPILLLRRPPLPGRFIYLTTTLFFFRRPHPKLRFLSEESIKTSASLFLCLKLIRRYPSTALFAANFELAVMLPQDPAFVIGPSQAGVGVRAHVCGADFLYQSFT